MIVKRIQNTLYSSNSYLIYCNTSHDAWLVDVGDFEEIFKFLPEEKQIKGAFITHAHNDHIYGLNSLIEVFPDCIIYASDFCKLGLYSEKLNLSFYREQPFVFKGMNLQVLCENDGFELFSGCKISVVETPGHNWGSLTYVLNDYLFTGDSYIPNYDVVTKLKGGDKLQSVFSLEKIHNLIKPEIKVCPGHGPIYINNLPI